MAGYSVVHLCARRRGGGRQKLFLSGTGFHSFFVPGRRKLAAEAIHRYHRAGRLSFIGVVECVNSFHDVNLPGGGQ